MTGHTGPPEGARAEVRGHLLHSSPHPSGSHPCLVFKLGWADSSLTVGPSCTCHQAYMVGVKGLVLERILEEKERVRRHFIWFPKGLVSAPNQTQEFALKIFLLNSFSVDLPLRSPQTSSLSSG